MGKSIIQEKSWAKYSEDPNIKTQRPDFLAIQYSPPYIACIETHLRNETHLRKRNQPGHAGMPGKSQLRKNTGRAQKCSLLRMRVHNNTYRQNLRKLPYKSIFMALQTYFEIQIYITMKFIYSYVYVEIMGAVSGIITP